MNLANIQSKNPNCLGSAKDAIANFYGVDSSVLESWMHSLSVLRNHCAHQSRVILKALSIQPMRPKSSKVVISSLWQSGSALHNILLILVYLNDRVEPHSLWRNDLLEFLSKNSQKAVEFLGFPTDWQSNPFWK